MFVLVFITLIILIVIQHLAKLLKMNIKDHNIT